jgi:hypothetical protein
MSVCYYLELRQCYNYLMRLLFYFKQSPLCFVVSEQSIEIFLSNIEIKKASKNPYECSKNMLMNAVHMFGK